MRTSRAAWALGAAVTALAAAASSAQAADVSVTRPPCAPEQSKYGACYPDEARFKAADGEANRVTITRSVDPPAYQPQVVIKDDGAALNAGAGCTQVDQHTVTCTGYNLLAVVDAGDGDDVVEGPGTLDGGPGNDVLKGTYVLSGGPGDDHLEGGDQAEYLQGGPGADTISGGPGNDTIEPDGGQAAEQDVVDGGDGTDVVSYQSRKAAVTVSLTQPFAGEDRLSAIEGIRGGAGADRLTGDAGPNTIEGGPGNDVLAGGDGDDVLAGQDGADRLDGGAGGDKLDAGDDRAASALTCGAGSDKAEPGPNTLVADDCEAVAGSDLELVGTLSLLLPQPAPRAPIVALRGATCLERPCSVTMSVTAASGAARGTLLASRRIEVVKGRGGLPRRISLGLGADAARTVKRAGRLRARIRVAVNDAGDVARTSFIVILGHG